MAANDPGPAPALVSAKTDEDSIKADVQVRHDNDSMGELDRPVAPDQFDERFQTGKYELWAYYSYYIGNNVSIFCLVEDVAALHCCVHAH